MSVFFAQAWAAEAGGQTGAGWLEFLPLILLFVIFYFFLIRPQMKRSKEHRALVSALEKGDEVVTSGGVVGQISKVEDDFIVCEVAPKTELRFQRAAVVATLPKGTLKKLESGSD